MLDFSKREIAVISYTSKAPLLGFTISQIFSLLYTKLIDVSIVYQYLLKVLLCMYTQLQDKLTYDYATLITCDNNPRNTLELDPASGYQDSDFQNI